MSKTTNFHNEFAAMIEAGTYGRANRFEKAKTRSAEKTARRQSTRRLVAAHFAGDLA